MTWQLSEENQHILDYAMAKIKSVPYVVTARWTFYQLVQAGLVRKEKAGNFEYLVNRARKSFYGEWYPGLLEDSVRETHFNGERWVGFSYEEDSIREQGNYVQLWFEAEAMYGQFEHYTKDYRVSLVPFRGDCSIPIKWELAKKIEAMSEKYHKPIKTLYFGDYDKKGLLIFDSAVKDIKQWATRVRVPWSIERVGLTMEQAQELDIPDNPNKPGSYQWEALNDAQAGKLITDAVSKYLTRPSTEFLKREAERHDAIENLILDYLKELREND
jgi:hypothetical protein